MLSRSDIDNLKRLNGIRKKLGLAIDTDNFNTQSLLLAINDKTRSRGQK
ncbi:MAG: hypothetical protein JW894_10105 [Bacteroidales bacterium]|nr:hypothetical protein [Bacteroidales bacterium]